jgi:predicted choloylglycine hydrolase
MLMTGLVTIIMVFSIPIVAILTNHFQKQTKLKRDMLKDELELEKVRHENYLLETEKMKLELQKSLSPNKDEFIMHIK